jgi:hypothetical protein
MPKFKVPEQDVEGVKLLASLSAEAAQQVAAVLEESPSLDDDTLASVLRKVTGIDEDRSLESARALATMYSVIQMHHVSPKEFTSEIMRSLPGLESESAAALECLLEIGSMRILAKMEELTHYEGRAYCSARILTDLRPVFGDEIDAGPCGFSIVHNLNLRFHEVGDQGRHRTLQLLLSGEDIDELVGVLERAKLKAKTLRSTLDSAGIRYLDGGHS